MEAARYLSSWAGIFPVRPARERTAAGLFLLFWGLKRWMIVNFGACTIGTENASRAVVSASGIVARTGWTVTAVGGQKIVKCNNLKC